ncbi:MAG: hypothetical protein ACE5ES_03200 [Candidatus Nanoarchaeia archaeon]
MIINFKKDKTGQVWIETIIYTLIAFIIIGTVLAFVKPKIQEMQDKAIIEQSIVMMEDLDSTISGIDIGGAGNRRVIELAIKKGVLTIDGNSDKIIFEIEGKHTYSEPGKDIEIGDFIAHTEKKGDSNTVTLTRDYSEKYNISYNNEDELKALSKTSTIYKLSITNKGKYKFESGSCPGGSVEECAATFGYSISCVDISGANTCIYTSNRKTINIELA